MVNFPTTSRHPLSLDGKGDWVNLVEICRRWVPCSNYTACVGQRRNKQSHYRLWISTAAEVLGGNLSWE